MSQLLLQVQLYQKSNKQNPSLQVNQDRQQSIKTALTFITQRTIMTKAYVHILTLLGKFLLLSFYQQAISKNLMTFKGLGAIKLTILTQGNLFYLKLDMYQFLL